MFIIKTFRGTKYQLKRIELLVIRLIFGHDTNHKTLIGSNINVLIKHLIISVWIFRNNVIMLVKEWRGNL